MSQLLPSAFFFRFALPVHYIAELPHKRGPILDLPESCRLPTVHLSAGQSTFGDLRLAWNGQGLGISVHVRGKSMPISRIPQQPSLSDGLQIWLDTRNTQNIHRASRYCHQFCFLPAQEKKSSSPLGMEIPIARAREEREIAAPEDLRIFSKPFTDGYLLEAWLPAKVLVGFEPDANSQIGFYYLLQDAELGRRVLSVESEFPFDQDPSLWTTLELVSE